MQCADDRTQCEDVVGNKQTEFSARGFACGGRGGELLKEGCGIKERLIYFHDARNLKIFKC